MKISCTALDKKFSVYIRTLGNWQCARCATKYYPPTNALHCAHMFTRSKQSTRFDVDNCKPLCYGCHSYLDRNPLEKYAWYVNKYGRRKFDLLRLRSNTPQKLDRELINLWVTKELERLGSV